MNIKLNKHGAKDALDRLGRAAVRASASNEREAEVVADSPFLYARVRARIAAERERREASDNWLALLNVVWRSAPALALVAVLAFVLFWSASLHTRTPDFLSDEALLSRRDAGLENVLFTERNSLSSDEVLATILNEEEREGSK